MPRGPKGQWRPPHPIACAMHVGRILTGEIEETFEPPKGGGRRPGPGGRRPYAGRGGGPRAPAEGRDRMMTRRRAPRAVFAELEELAKRFVAAMAVVLDEEDDQPEGRRVFIMAGARDRFIVHAVYDDHWTRAVWFMRKGDFVGVLSTIARLIEELELGLGHLFPEEGGFDAARRGPRRKIDPDRLARLQSALSSA